MSILAKDVTKIYGTQKALDQVSFEIPAGDIVGFLGPNGAGKSTMMKIITCYLEATSGTVEVCGMDVSEQARDVKRLVGYLPEHNPLYPDMYVREYLRFVARLYKVPSAKNRVEEMIERVGLVPEARKRIGELSKGYRQRVGLAQAMIHDPKVLILDEPTSGLDPNQLVGIRKLIRSIGEEKTVMLSTHIMQEVEAICNRVLIIDKGAIAADSNVAELRNLKNSSSYALELEIEGSMGEVELRAIDGITQVESIGENKWRVVVSTSEDIRQTIFKKAVELGSTVLGMTRLEQSLEDVFKELTAQPKS